VIKSKFNAEGKLIAGGAAAAAPAIATE